MKLRRGSRLKHTLVTTTYQATTDDEFLYCTDAAASFTITLPPVASATGKRIWVKKTNSSTNTITIDGNGSETIDGSANFLLTRQYESVCLFCDGSSWYVLDYQQSQPGELILTTGNGHGSTNTKIRRYSVTETNNASVDLTYADSAGNGMSVTIINPGIYAIDAVDSNAGGGANLGISVNSNQLTTSIQSITAAHRKMIQSTTTANLLLCICCTVKLAAGDVVRVHTDGAPNLGSDLARFSIRYIGR